MDFEITTYTVSENKVPTFKLCVTLLISTDFQIFALVESIWYKIHDITHLTLGIVVTFQQCKNLKNRLRFDKVTESLEMGTFLRHSEYTTSGNALAVFEDFLRGLWLTTGQTC